MTGKRPPGLWPIRPKPLADELLSCWIMRLAHGLGLKVQTFCNVLWGKDLQIWNRDIDRLGPDQVLMTLSSHTGVTPDRAYATSLRIYEGRIFWQRKESGVLPWIQSLKLLHRIREGFGMQFCGICLTEDRIPYFRKRWRVAFCTICAKHRTMLHDRCPACGSAIAFHRVDVGTRMGARSSSLIECYVCGFDLRDAPRIEIVSFDTQVSEWHYNLCASLERDSAAICLSIGIDELRVLHHLVHLIRSRYKSVRLREHICSILGCKDLLAGRDWASFEGSSLTERHFSLQLGEWLFVDLETRLRDAWLDRKVRYNQLLKDLDHVPEFYARVVADSSEGRRGQRPKMVS